MRCVLAKRAPWLTLPGFVLLSCGAAAQSVDYARSQISCISIQMKVPVEAVFRKFTAQLSFDPAKPEAGKAQIEIDVASFDIGSDDLWADVTGRNWFDAKTHPIARFVSASVRALGGGKFEARGPLTIKGRTHDVAAPFTVKADSSGNSVFEGGFTIKRLQFNIGEGLWRDTDTVADDVQIKFRIVTTGKLQPKKSS